MVFGGVAAAVLLLGFAAWSMKSNRIPLDPETLCPTDRPVAHTIVLIDKTDPLSVGHQRVFETVINTLKTDLATHERLSIFVLTDEDYSSPVPVFSLCKPSDGEDANELYQNPSKLRARYQEHFGAPLDTVTAALVEGDERPYSPIMEMMQEIAVLPEFSPEATTARRLILFSDMLQNVPAYTHYGGGIPDFAAFEQSPYANRVLATLSPTRETALLRDVSVEIYYLIRPRTEGRQVRGHILFWERFFAWLSGRIDTVRAVR